MFPDINSDKKLFICTLMKNGYINIDKIHMMRHVPNTLLNNGSSQNTERCQRVDLLVMNSSELK